MRPIKQAILAQAPRVNVTWKNFHAEVNCGSDYFFDVTPNALF